MKNVGICVPLVAALAACNGMPGGSMDLPGTRPAGEVRGVVTLGPVADADVRVYALSAKEFKGERLAQGKTDKRGAYTIALTAKTQPVVVEVSGGSYVEAASGRTVTWAEGQNLRAVAWFTSATSSTIVVTPYTHAASGLAEYKMVQGVAPEQAVTASLAEISAAFDVDIVATVPRDIADAANRDRTLSEDYLYGFQMAALSSWTLWAGEQNRSESHSVFNSIVLAQIMYNDIRADGRLDGRGLDKSGQPTPLALGVVPLHQDVYRIAFAQHMMSMAGNPVNRTSLTVNDLLASAHSLVNKQLPVFAGEREAAGAEPGIIAIEPKGLFHSGQFDFLVVVRGITPVASVSYFVDDIAAGEVPDPQRPVATIDSTQYADGPHALHVVARDPLGHESQGTFELQFDNTAPYVNVTSARAVNASSYRMSGDYADNGAGVRRIRVQDTEVAVSPDNTWSVDLALSAGPNVVPIVVVDFAGNERRIDFAIELDNTAPVIESAGHAKVRFADGGGGYTEGVLQDQNNELPLYLTAAQLDLGGLALKRSSLDKNGIAYFAVRVNDPTSDVAAVELQYAQAGAEFAAARALTPVDGEYLIPLVAEVLGSGWDRVAPQELHRVRLIATDGAGNRAKKELTFKADIHVADVSVATSDLNESLFTSTPFAKRAQLHTMTFAATAYRYKNNTARAFYMSVADDGEHTAELTVEEMKRKHEARLKTFVEWQVGTVVNPNQACPQVAEWRSVPAVQDFNGAGWVMRAPPEPVYGDLIALDSDALPPVPEADAWTDSTDADGAYAQATVSGYLFVLSYRYDLVQDADLGAAGAAMVADWTLIDASGYSAPVTCPEVRAFQQRQVYAYESLPGHPANYGNTFTETAAFKTSAFEVYDEDAAAEITAVQGWYRIPAGHAVTVRKLVTTPALNVYDDADVGDRNAFSSYVRRRYDLRITWTVRRAATFSVVHDAGEGNIALMSPHRIDAGAGAMTYRIER